MFKGEFSYYQHKFKFILKVLNNIVSVDIFMQFKIFIEKALNEISLCQGIVIINICNSNQVLKYNVLIW